MSELLGNSFAVFIGITVVLAGGAAWLMGQALASRWRPLWQVFPYALLMGLSDRFIIYALFDGELLSLGGFLVDTAVITAIALIAFRVTRVLRMVSQYPWLYERVGPFAWRAKR